MNGNEIIELAWRTYVEEFAQFVAKASKAVTDGVAEVQTERPEDKALFRGLYRVDFAGQDGHRMVATELNPDRRVRLETPLEGAAGAMKVRMVQIVWDDVGIRHDAPGDLTAAVTPWFEHWFDPEDKRKPAGEGGLVGVIHSVSMEPGVLHVDFGTATPDAFWALMALLRDAGATRAMIGETRPPPKGKAH
jgi:hypothetical protein